MKIIHLRDQYLRVSFVYFLLKGFRKYEHWVACREIITRDLKLYPYGKIIKTSRLFSFTWLLDKFLTVKMKFKARPVNDWVAYYQLLKEEADILVLHAHMGPQGYYAIPLAEKLKKNLFVTFYGSDMSDVPKLPGWDERYHTLFHKAARIIVEGEFMKGKIVELGCPAHKVAVVRIGIPLGDIPFSYRKRPVGGEPLRILMCANFYPKKGFLRALEAFRIMLGKGFSFQAQIVGSGPQEQQMKEYVNANGLASRVTFLGSRTLPQIYQLSQNMHLFFHPSETAPDGGSEGGAPTIILEMQALGLPVIATTHADIPHIIPEANHFLAAEYDAKGLVQQFERLLAMDDWNALSDRGLKFVTEYHSNIACAARLEELYAQYNKTS
ncbi:hypothetical protein DLD77_05440 [Chitinophaga alhagiae]|uniref:Colanic acid biosynthesis glycosyltransferase WcaL n=1 Tax=Chitinophaga alhagiae TaxID=2203219 RepID=A0ABN5LPJ4_9BACT|nr:glycosyltransferase [Chitinophaga alhagiae]AWO01172.1 hypothetical protein DLD77_05440 [Chitinophaga alhagiae]